MATKTPKLGLVKPAKGEYEGTWHLPMNGNADILDEKVGGTADEVAAARGSQSNLAARLTVSMNNDGSLKPVPDVTKAQSSTVYGNESGGIPYALFDRLEKGDRETFDARSGAASLQAAVAFAADDDVHNTVLSAPPGFLSFTGAQAKVDGSVTNVVSNINGYRQVVRTLKSTTITGAAGTYYIYLQKQTSGDLLLDRTGLGQNTGIVSVDTGSGFLKKFSDGTQNFNTLGVQPGDILEVTSVGSSNKGQYIVESILSNTEILVIGLFVTAQSNLNYKITNPLAPALGFDAVAHAKRFARVANKIYIGRAVFDGANITSITSYAIKGRFEQFVSISLTLGDFSQTISHNLGYVPSKVQFFASQANDFSQDLEPLSVAEMTASTLQRSVISKMGDMTLDVKNATNGVFYKSYAGVTQTSGFLLVVAER